MNKTRLMTLALIAGLTVAGCGQPSEAAAGSESRSRAAVADDATVTRQLNLVAGTARTNGSEQGTGDWAMAAGGAPEPDQLP